jgi:hypothetical protein
MQLTVINTAHTVIGSGIWQELLLPRGAFYLVGPSINGRLQ